MTVQLAKLSGFTVIATASAKNFELIKSLGADHVLSYSDAATPAKIKEITNNELYLAFDTVSENGTSRLVIDSLGEDSKIPAGKSKQIITVLPQDLGDAAQGIKIDMLSTYALFGKAVSSIVYSHATGSNFSRLWYTDIGWKLT